MVSGLLIVAFLAVMLAVLGFNIDTRAGFRYGLIGWFLLVGTLVCGVTYVVGI